MRILVTGGLGFIGSHLVDFLLKNNHKIKVLTKSLSKKSNIKTLSKNLQIVKIDITNFKKLGEAIEEFKPQIIFHLAGNTSHSKSFVNPLKDVDSNSKTTLFMLEKIRHLEYPCRFILASTFIVIGKPKKLPITEESPCNPITIYGTNRLSSEYYCKIYHRVYGLNTNIFRITNSYGPREQIIPNKNAVNFLIHKAFRNEQVSIYDNGKFFRDFIYIDDVIRGIGAIMNKGKPGELYWISSGKKTWFYKFGKILEKYTDCKITYLKTPVYSKKVDVGNFVVRNSKLQKLGWKPKITIETGVKKTLKFFESN